MNNVVRKSYHSPYLEKITKDNIDGIIPLLMSGGSGEWGGSVTPSYLNVYVVNSPGFFYGALGHSAILFENDYGEVHLFSFHPYDNVTPRGAGSIAQIADDREEANFQSFKSACFTKSGDSSVAPGILVSNGNITWYEPFRRALRLKVSYSQFYNMQSFARRSVASPHSYVIASYNCQTYINELLATGKVVLGKSLGSGNVISYAGALVPNIVYEGANLAGSNGVLEMERIVF